MLNFLFVTEVSLLWLELVVFVSSLFAKPICCPTGEPRTNMALNFQSNCLAFLVPHCWGHILFREDDFVIPGIDVNARFFHLDTKLPHHLSRLCLVLICLHLSLNLIGMEVARLVSLSECMMVSDTWSIVSETTKISLRSLLFFNSYCHNFDLIVCKSDFDIEFVGHDELISFDRVIVVLLLFGNLVTILSHHLLLHLLLLESLYITSIVIIIKILIHFDFDRFRRTGR